MLNYIFLDTVEIYAHNSISDQVELLVVTSGEVTGQ